MKEKTRSVYGELLFAVFFLFVAIFAYYKAMFMTSGTWYSPSVFPKLTSLLIASLCIYEIAVSVRKFYNVRDSRAAFLRIFSFVLSHAVDRNVLFMILMIILLAFVLPVLRFTASTLLFLVVCMFFYCEKKSIRSFAIYLLSSFGFVAFSLVVFKTIFNVVLP